jgi:radical SAM-linked protein
VAQPAVTDADRRTEGGGRAWAVLLAASGLPLVGEGGGRVRVTPAAPLPLGIAGEREVVDVYLAERRTVAEVRQAVAAALPPEWALVDLHDVWVGAPAAPAAVVAADYRVLVVGAPRWALEGAAMSLLAAGSLPRERRREKRTTAYDLRPLLLDVGVRAAGGEGVTLAIRLRHGPDAVGRPEEVVAALGEPPAPALAAPLDVRSVVRERLVLADDPDAPPAV